MGFCSTDFTALAGPFRGRGRHYKDASYTTTPPTTIAFSGYMVPKSKWLSGFWSDGHCSACPMRGFAKTSILSLCPCTCGIGCASQPEVVLASSKFAELHMNLSSFYTFNMQLSSTVPNVGEDRLPWVDLEIHILGNGKPC